ncbi:Oligosaccaryltransferase domain-containing protein [Trichoderma chlorosporum]
MQHVVSLSYTDTGVLLAVLRRGLSNQELVIKPIPASQIAVSRLALLRSSSSFSAFTMISDDELYRLAIFLGSISMVLIVVYHFLEVNSQEKSAAAVKKAS